MFTTGQYDEQDDEGESDEDESEEERSCEEDINAPKEENGDEFQHGVL